jgi:hypothetical protein
MIVNEVGPWRVKRGATVTTRGTVRLAASTLMRVDASGAFAGDFIEVAPHACDSHVLKKPRS